MKVQFRSILTTNPKMRPLLVSSFIAAVLMTASSSSSRASSPSLLEMELAERMAEEEAAKAFAGDNDRLGISTDVTETYFLVQKNLLDCSMFQENFPSSFSPSPPAPTPPLRSPGICPPPRLRRPWKAPGSTRQKRRSSSSTGSGPGSRSQTSL